jgi:hypothetical protein
MGRVDEIERQFRALHDVSFQSYEARVKRWKDDCDEEIKRLQADEKEMREGMKQSGIDLALLDQRARHSADNLEKHLASTRPGLAGRASSRAAEFKERSLVAAVMGEAGDSVVQSPPYAASLFAVDKSKLTGIEGEASDGPNGVWVFPENPGRIELQAKSKGDGWGCWATASPPPTMATIWFTFVPNRTARWEISPIVAFHGFYILRANDTLLTCKMARVELTARVDILQYFWKGGKTYNLIDIEKDDVNRFEPFDRTEWVWDTQYLRAGDPVWVKVDIWADTAAAGGGSYAEVNFADGEANYIEPVFMSAQPV